MNLYGALAELKTRLGITGTTDDTQLMYYLLDASRAVDELTHRYFYTKTATIYADTVGANFLLLPEDFISITTLTTDSEGDDTYDGETWTENTDFWVWPYNNYPKYGVQTTQAGNYTFSGNTPRYVKIVGVFGYGDNTSDPWTETAIGGTVDISSTTLTLTAEGTIDAGHTIKIDSEQMYVSAVTSDASDEATVERAVNGTTAAAHVTSGGDTISLAQYPAKVVNATYQFAARFYRQAGKEVLESERIGDYSYRRFKTSDLHERDANMVSKFIRRSYYNAG